jgi:hypothetical protein
MQKLLTIYLDNGSYKSGHMIVTNYADVHGLVEEHLADYLRDGWRVVSLTGLGGNSEALAVRGWLGVVLEK